MSIFLNMKDSTMKKRRTSRTSKNTLWYSYAERKTGKINSNGIKGCTNGSFEV
jgi:hypothetical protein